MATRYEETQCFLCPNNCTITMEVSDIGLVEAVWRLRPQHNEMKKEQCKRLNELRGKSLDRAMDTVQKPIKPTYVAGGH